MRMYGTTIQISCCFIPIDKSIKRTNNWIWLEYFGTGFSRAWCSYFKTIMYSTKVIMLPPNVSIHHGKCVIPHLTFLETLPDFTRNSSWDSTKSSSRYSISNYFTYHSRDFSWILKEFLLIFSQITQKISTEMIVDYFIESPGGIPGAIPGSTLRKSYGEGLGGGFSLVQSLKEYLEKF